MRIEILRSKKGRVVVCPKCGCEVMSAETTSIELEVACGSASRSELRLPCECAVWVRDIDRFNRDPGHRSLEYGYFNEKLIPRGERIRVFCYVNAEIEGMLSHLGYEMKFEEMPSVEEMDDENSSYPICSGEQVWIRGMSTAYVNKQYCGCSGFSGDTYVAIVGTIGDWRQVADLIDLHYERAERNRGRGWHILTGKWGRWVWFRRATHETFARDPELVEKTFEITEGFRMIFGQV